MPAGIATARDGGFDDDSGAQQKRGCRPIELADGCKAESRLRPMAIERAADPGAAGRRARHRRDRQLRNVGRWLVSVGAAWYLLGRGLQLIRHDVSAPGWWWGVTLTLLVCGGSIWVARRVRWRAAGRSSSPYASA